MSLLDKLAALTKDLILIKYYSFSFSACYDDNSLYIFPYYMCSDSKHKEMVGN